METKMRWVESISTGVTRVVGRTCTGGWGRVRWARVSFHGCGRVRWASLSGWGSSEVGQALTRPCRTLSVVLNFQEPR